MADGTVVDEDFEGPPSPADIAENERQSLYWTTLATMLGYNELAKLAKTLGEKVYFRLLRGVMQDQFVKRGGNADVFAEEEHIVEIAVPYANMPHIRFRKQDIELMRDAVYKHDVVARQNRA